MLTERYIVSFFGANITSFSQQELADFWKKSADREYESSGIYITALIEENHFVNRTEELYGDIAYVVVSVRNPTETGERDTFWEIYKNVVRSVRADLQNPEMTITKQIIDFFYFVEL